VSASRSAPKLEASPGGANTAARTCVRVTGNRQGRLQTGMAVVTGYPSPCGCALLAPTPCASVTACNGKKKQMYNRYKCVHDNTE